jgi:predicted transcriptional regulator
MQPQTYSLLAALSSPESVELVLALLEQPGSVEELARRLEITSPTASRRLEGLALAGVVTRASSRSAYEVVSPEETRRVLDAFSDLSISILEKRASAEQALQRRVRKTRLRASSKSETLDSDG